MSSTYVGDHPRQLESGQPVVFGDVLDSLDPADELALGPWLVPVPSAPAPSAPAPVASPAPAPEPAPVTPTTSEAS